MDKYDRFVEEHKRAKAEYAAAFAKVGARMWRDDHCNGNHTAANIAFMRKNKTSPRHHRPLTVLDSYPKVTRKQRAWLDAEVDRIWRKYR